MPIIKEFREFFKRDTQVTTGSKADKEANFPTKYTVKGIKQFNRFLKGHYPSEAVLIKFLESIVFKLNPEDTASLTTQGLVIKATDDNAAARTNNTSSDYTASVVTHQLPEVTLTTDGSDTTLAVVSANGLKLTILKRTISSYFRKNYKVEVIVDKSIEVDGTTKKLQLIGDATTPGGRMLYGTNVGGTKAWYPIDYIQRMYLAADFDKANATLADITVSTSSLAFNLGATKYYKFDIVLFITPDMTGGVAIDLNGTVGVSEMIYDITYLEQQSAGTPTLTFSERVVALASSVSKAGIEPGTCRITGTIKTTTGGTLVVRFAQSTGSGTSTVKKGSVGTLEEEVLAVYTA